MDGCFGRRRRLRTRWNPAPLTGQRGTSLRAARQVGCHYSHSRNQGMCRSKRYRTDGTWHSTHPAFWRCPQADSSLSPQPGLEHWIHAICNTNKTTRMSQRHLSTRQNGQQGAPMMARGVTAITASVAAILSFLSPLRRSRCCCRFPTCTFNPGWSTVLAVTQ